MEQAEPTEGSTAASMLASYFEGSGMTLQEYFKFPEMKKIRNPVHEYFRLGKIEGGSDWLEQGELALDETDGWMVLGAEHLELARIAVRGSGSRHYLARPWDGFYTGPLLRGTAAGLKMGVYVVGGAASLSSRVLLGALSIVYSPSPYVPPYDADLADRFVEESVEVDGETWYFRVWLPPDMERVRKEQGGLPVFLLLHGFKECGWDNWYQMNAGLALKLQNWSWAKWFPGIVVMPQLPRRPWDEQWWEHWRSPAMQRMALACLQQAVSKYRADTSRQYVVGESLGTEGAWFLAAAKPGHFAAVGGSCGSVDPYDWNSYAWGPSSPQQYQKLADSIGQGVPMWFCHGGNDDFVPPEQSRRLYEALQTSRAGRLGAMLGRSAAEVVFKEYEDLDHHVWDRAYDEDHLIEWLLSHRKA